MCITPTWPSLTLLLCLISEPEEDASPGWDVIYSTLKLVPGGFAAAACTVSNRKNIFLSTSTNSGFCLVVRIVKDKMKEEERDCESEPNLYLYV